MFEALGSTSDLYAGVVKLADAPDSKSGDRKVMGVRFPPPALPSSLGPLLPARFNRNWVLHVAALIFLVRIAQLNQREGLVMPVRCRSVLVAFVFGMSVAVAPGFAADQGQVPPRQPTTAEIVRQNAPATVAISGLDATGEGVSGTGFVVDSSGTIVTNLHVIQGLRTLTVRFSTETLSIERRFERTKRS